MSDEWGVGLALFGILYLFELNAFGLFYDISPLYQHLGAEYYNIALALVDGRGFSDPFAELTGPTAWMPPLFPILLAGLLELLGSRVAVGEAIVLLTVSSLSAVGVMLLRMAKRSAACLTPYAIVALYVAWLWAFYFWFFFITHDIWLLTLLVAGIVDCVHQYSMDARWSRWRWALLGALAALASPSLAVAWFALSAVLFFGSRVIRKDLLVAAAVACCAASPWLLRNAIVFHEFIPTKSNLFYEAYQANYRYPEGLYDNTWKEHPNVSSRFRFQYAALGETRFLQDHEEKFWAALRADPDRYVGNVMHRLLAVSVAHPDASLGESSEKMLAQRIIYPVPVIGLLLGLWLGSRKRALLWRLGAFWAFYLAPYVLVAFYDRYLLPLTSALMLTAFLGADQLKSRMAKRWTAVTRARREV